MRVKLIDSEMGAFTGLLVEVGADYVILEDRFGLMRFDSKNARLEYLDEQPGRIELGAWVEAVFVGGHIKGKVVRDESTYYIIDNGYGVQANVMILKAVIRVIKRAPTRAEWQERESINRTLEHTQDKAVKAVCYGRIEELEAALYETHASE
jgi:hypothetical protein